MLEIIKRQLRQILPVSRTYMDQKIQQMEQELQKKQEINSNKILQDLKKKNDKLQKEIIGVKQSINQEFIRRDDWKARAAEAEYLAKGRPIWVIKCPAPEGEMKVRWGDYHFALSLKKYLERQHCYVMIDMREDWGCETEADVVLVLRGCHFYRPDRRNKKCLYIMWNISHPDMVSSEEYLLYDVVCVGSKYYADKLNKEVSVPVIPLLQCTDTEVFYPADQSCDKRWNYIFIGNSRGVARNCVMWAIEEGLPLRMWGSGWNTILRDHMDLFEAPTIENSMIPELYRSAKVTLNDHWKDMIQNQFINNRIFDSLACGLPIISDGFSELEEIFPEAVLYYHNKEEFKACIRAVEEDYDQVKEKVLAQWPMIKKEYSFETRARELVEIAGKYKAEKYRNESK